MRLPYLGQWNVSIFSKWIEGWFVWILLINCRHVNYWCSGVRPAFPVTDGLCSQVISPLYRFLLSPSFPMLQLQSGKRISILCFSSPQLPPFFPVAPVSLSSCNSLWHFCNSIHNIMKRLLFNFVSSSSSILSIHRPFSSKPFDILLTFLPLIFLSQACQNWEGCPFVSL